MASASFITRMKVLIVGSGGREHALACALKKSRHELLLYCIGNNAGISQIATMVALPLSAHRKIVDYAKEIGIEFVVIGPDEQLVNGLADLFNEASIPCFGPSKKAARIEGSKAYAKEFMKAHQIPTPAYQVFDEVEPAKEYLKQCSYPLVIKADGLAFGKGVIIAQSKKEAEQALEQMMVQRFFGDSGSTIVIEEFVTGEEVSLLVFSDGVHTAAMISAMDHKRAGDGDTGLNTGGMGVIAPNPFYTESIASYCMQHIVEPTICGLAEDGIPFVGCLFFGLMLSKTGPVVIEYNCRFGDPEAEAVLSLLESDLFDIFKACTEGTLDQIQVSFSTQYACSVALVSGGYPEQYKVGRPITIRTLPSDVQVLHAATTYDASDCLVTNGGRVLHVVANADTLERAIDLAYKGVACISFEDMSYRTDIGQRARTKEA